MTTDLVELPTQLEAMRNSEERWLELLADNTEGEVPLNRTLFICHWAVAETAAKIVNSILYYVETIAKVELRAETEPVENWEHEGFSKAFSGEKPAEVTKHIWSNQVYPKGWSVRDITMKAVKETAWLTRAQENMPAAKGSGKGGKAGKALTMQDFKRVLTASTIATIREIGSRRYGNITNWADCEFNEAVEETDVSEVAEVREATSTSSTGIESSLGSK